ncbi:hypothetical protein LBBP_00705 [Leptospira borgpetersenii serovar Ballum]|uniref:Uncharacterized protein n=1 Tax=Leptospira borgpetersenii serovar Ballum TaxID=280505 RepID=A0A0S2IMZ1_LEPBO|nr:hypothetical protein LBBP_00705 [Leptospira borgpetersenii serovar Ballum]
MIDSEIEKEVGLLNVKDRLFYFYSKDRKRFFRNKTPRWMRHLQ